DVDNEGYFTAYLTDEQVEQIKAGEVKMHISYPSYEDQYTGRTVGTFPPELLSPDRDKAGAYRLFRPRKRRARPGYFTSLIDKMLPKLDGIGIEFNAERARNKMVLVCFADVYQRPSRHCVRELTRRAEELKEEGVVVVCVQGSKTDQQELNDWIKKNEVAFPVGMIEGDEEEVRSKWGVKSLPWLILTDRNHIVTAEGFGIEELEGRIEHAAPRSGQPQSTEISPHEILKQYEHGLSAFTQVCAIDVESSVVVKENGVETRRFIILYEYRRDNDRFDVNCVECGVDDEGNRIEDSAWRRRAICDGNGHAIFYYGPSAIPQEVEYTFDGSKQLGFTRAQMGTGLSLDGYLARDQVSVIKLLSNSADLRLREATEKVDGFECCVLEASTSHGSYTLWLDPQHGYLARKAVVKKQNADIFDHKPLTEIDWLAGISFTMNSVRIERRGGVFVPVGSRNTEVWHKSDGQTETRVHHHRRTRIDLEPDFAALGAFAPNIPDGTEVVVGVQGIAVKYIWKQGKVVDSEGRDVALTAGEPLSLVGKGLPDFEGTGVDFDLKRAEGKRVLVCFFDMNQRPSRHCVMELTKRAEELKEKSIDAICVQASRVEQQKLDDWVRKNHVPFSMGMIQKNEEQNRFTWGVKSLPWLILADKEHIVRAEGLQLEQLNEKIKESNDADY
ncbi:MAG: redoxin domain-containing protein, partial [Planctomycetota bacterium]